MKKKIRIYSSLSLALVSGIILVALLHLNFLGGVVVGAAASNLIMYYFGTIAMAKIGRRFDKIINDHKKDENDTI